MRINFWVLMEMCFVSCIKRHSWFHRSKSLIQRSRAICIIQIAWPIQLDIVYKSYRISIKELTKAFPLMKLMLGKDGTTKRMGLILHVKRSEKKYDTIYFADVIRHVAIFFVWNIFDLFNDFFYFVTC